MHPELLGIGIDDDAALVVRKNVFEVVGTGSIAIYDNAKHEGGTWYEPWLKPGERFDLATGADTSGSSHAPLGPARTGSEGPFYAAKSSMPTNISQSLPTLATWMLGAVVVLLLLSRCINILRQYERGIVFRLG